MGMPNFDINEIQELFTQIGLSSPLGVHYAERQKKCDQLNDYLIIMQAALKRFSTKRILTFLDCGCGRSYLSFFLNYSLQQMGWGNLRFIGIDSNAELIDKCRHAASVLGFSNMEFYSSSILECPVVCTVDIAYSLHACDIATDQTIYKGIVKNARYIMSVSCCQHFTRSQIKRHPLTGITRFNHYKERLVDMVSDSLRALLLEAYGYKVDVFEFTASKNTPKNIMLRAERTNMREEKTRKALNDYQILSDMFHIKPALEQYLNQFASLNNVYGAGTLKENV
jgi:SAM-dependent methyltransferase